MKETLIMLYLVRPSSKNIQNSKSELDWSKDLSKERAKEYLFSRGHARDFLSNIYNIPPLEIPLFSPPGKAPILKNNFGYLSISHCENAFFIGWSKFPIGVDIEKKNRDFPAEKILKKYYSEEEKSLLSKFENSKLKEKILDYWLIKESSFKLRGTNLMSNLKYLIVNHEKQIVLNKKFNISNKYFLTDFLDWKVSISFDMNFDFLKPLICYSN